MFLFRTTKLPVDIIPAPKIDEASAIPADMAERPRIRNSESTGSLPHVADMVKPGRKVSGIRAAFERSNKRVPSNPPRGRPQSPMKRQDSIPEAKMLSHEAEIARLRDELEKEKIIRKESETQTSRLVKEVEVLKDELKQKDSYWREELREKVHQARQEGGGPGKDMHSSRNQARLGDTGLQRQLTDLKRSISKSTRVETVITSDGNFVQEMGSLAHEVQNWIVNNYRRAKISASAQELSARLAPMVNNRQLERLEPLWAGWKSENKIAILQSTVAVILMDIFDDQLLFGMPPNDDWATSLRKTALHLSTVLEGQQYNKWRASTLDIVRQTAVMSKAIDSAASTMAEYVTSTLDVLSGQPSSDTKLSSLHPIVRRAVMLSHLFRIQRARFSFDLPAPLAAFDPSSMENVAFDRDADKGQPIDCATFPLVLKLGDEHGANVQWQNVLLKANVVCGET
jgi:activating signal cointegrator complex subunit 1